MVCGEVVKDNGEFIPQAADLRFGLWGRQQGTLSMLWWHKEEISTLSPGSCPGVEPSVRGTENTATRTPKAPRVTVGTAALSTNPGPRPLTPAHHPRTCRLVPAQSWLLRTLEGLGTLLKPPGYFNFRDSTLQFCHPRPQEQKGPTLGEEGTQPFNLRLNLTASQAFTWRNELVAARAQPLKDAGVLEGPPACPRWEHAHIHRLSPLLAGGKQGGVLKPEMHLDAKWDTSVSDQAGVGRGLTSPAAFPTDPANRHSTYRAFQTTAFSVWAWLSRTEHQAGLEQLQCIQGVHRTCTAPRSPTHHILLGPRLRAGTRGPPPSELIEGEGTFLQMGPGLFPWLWLSGQVWRRKGELLQAWALPRETTGKVVGLVCDPMCWRERPRCVPGVMRIPWGVSPGQKEGRLPRTFNFRSWSFSSAAHLGLAPIPQAGEPVPDGLVTVDHPTAQYEIPHLVFGHGDPARRIWACGACQEDAGSGRLPVAGGAQVHPEAPLTLEGDDVGGDVGQLQQHAGQWCRAAPGSWGDSSNRRKADQAEKPRVPGLWREVGCVHPGPHLGSHNSVPTVRPSTLHLTLTLLRCCPAGTLLPWHPLQPRPPSVGLDYLVLPTLHGVCYLSLPAPAPEHGTSHRSWRPQKKKAERWSAVGRLAAGGSPWRPGRAWLHRMAPEPRSRSRIWGGRAMMGGHASRPSSASRPQPCLPRRPTFLSYKQSASPVLDDQGRRVGFVVAEDGFSGRRADGGLTPHRNSGPHCLFLATPGQGWGGPATPGGLTTSPPPLSHAKWPQVTGQRPLQKHTSLIPRVAQLPGAGLKVHLGVISCPSSSTQASELTRSRSLPAFPGTCIRQEGRDSDWGWEVGPSKHHLWAQPPGGTCLLPGLDLVSAGWFPEPEPRMTSRHPTQGPGPTWGPHPPVWMQPVRGGVEHVLPEGVPPECAGPPSHLLIEALHRAATDNSVPKTRAWNNSRSPQPSQPVSSQAGPMREAVLGAADNTYRRGGGRRIRWHHPHPGCRGGQPAARHGVALKVLRAASGSARQDRATPVCWVGRRPSTQVKAPDRWSDPNSARGVHSRGGRTCLSSRVRTSRSGAPSASMTQDGHTPSKVAGMVPQGFPYNQAQGHRVSAPTPSTTASHSSVSCALVLQYKRVCEDRLAPTATCRQHHAWPRHRPPASQVDPLPHTQEENEGGWTQGLQILMACQVKAQSRTASGLEHNRPRPPPTGGASTSPSSPLPPWVRLKLEVTVAYVPRGTPHGVFLPGPLSLPSSLAAPLESLAEPPGASCVEDSLPVNKSTARKEPSLPSRTQAEDAPLSLGWGTAHSTRALMVPLAPDTAATKVQGEEKPGGRDPALWGCACSPATLHPGGPSADPAGLATTQGSRAWGPEPASWSLSSPGGGSSLSWAETAGAAPLPLRLATPHLSRAAAMIHDMGHLGIMNGCSEHLFRNKPAHPRPRSAHLRNTSGPWVRTVGVGGLLGTRRGTVEKLAASCRGADCSWADKGKANFGASSIQAEIQMGQTTTKKTSQKLNGDIQKLPQLVLIRPHMFWATHSKAVTSTPTDTGSEQAGKCPENQPLS
ncbi:hypothetical protein Cadr_000030923 [Camelus dromedarius]|uniref:Uncharacterized protein n=1 Tax=Camelus dromedarius TaxID=9838 RepID=A0A5N4BZ28_CAMDR|nr:hypothetical protein Cadr_000030923 [Camelus dromedarius]